MSAYMVTDKVINKCLARFRQQMTSTSAQSGGKWLVRPLSEMDYDLSDEAHLETLGHRMFNLNAAGVNSRYGEGEAEKFRPLDYAYEYLSTDGMMQSYATLGSLLYQCAEGDVPENDLYIALQEVYNRMAHTLVSSSKEYESARWGA